MHIETAHVSLRGDREQNQDRCAVIREHDCALLLLSDGMGGHPKGEVAAQILVDTGRTAFAAASKPIEDPLGFLDDILHSAHEGIISYGRNHNPPIDPRATAVAALVQKGKAYWSHAGDSRLYLIRKSRIVHRTKDHSFVEQMRRRGVFDGDDGPQRRFRNLVTMCLGGTSTRFKAHHGRPTALIPGDVLLLCSDGLWGQIPEEQLAPLIGERDGLTEIADELAQRAELSGAPTSDNVTLVALRWLGEDMPRRQAQVPAVDLSAGAPAPTPAAAQDPLQEAIRHLRAVIDDFESDK